MLDTGKARSALSFTFNKDTLQYEPRIIYHSSNYVTSSSIYHEIKTTFFIKEHIHEIKEPFVCTALPCQVRPLKAILSRNQIKHHIISLVCSSQQSFEATEYLLYRLNLKKSEVRRIQYRGNGWPSGIQLQLFSGEVKQISNLGSIWTQIFHSKLFCMDRCFLCNPHIVNDADVKLADPWRINKVRNDKVGHTLLSVSHPFKESILKPMAQFGNIVLEYIEPDAFIFSQQGVILLKERYLKHKKMVRAMKSLYKNRVYRNMVLRYSMMFTVHCFFKRIIEKFFIR